MEGVMIDAGGVEAVNISIEVAGLEGVGHFLRGGFEVLHGADGGGIFLMVPFLDVGVDCAGECGLRRCK